MTIHAESGKEVYKLLVKLIMPLVLYMASLLKFIRLIAGCVDQKLNLRPEQLTRKELLKELLLREKLLMIMSVIAILENQ